MSDHRFLDLPDLLEPGDLLVVNNTRVRSARLVGERVGTGGRIEILLLERRPDGYWEALAKPSRRLRNGIKIEFLGMTAEVMSDPSDGVVLLDLDADDPEAAIKRAGSIPLPPYFTGTLDGPDRYQTVFANLAGSAAAPTAGLHFTDDVLKGVAVKGIKVATVDLHVSLDTFRPMTTEDIKDHVMHSEWCSIPEMTAALIVEANRVVAVGTTVVRTLESFAGGAGDVRSGSHRTDIFIAPGFEFRVVDALITNFHMPSSTLLLLLAAFMGERWRDVYATALERRYRFLSFGDAMFAERTDS